MTDAGHEATTSVPPEPRAPRLPPRWVRRLVIGGAVAGTLTLALPSLLWALFRMRKPGGDSAVSGSAELSIEQEESGEEQAGSEGRKALGKSRR
jgi:hypothetical protein